jgi:hypothetical protein
MPLRTGHAGRRAQYARLCPDCAPGYGDRGSFAPYARTNSPVRATLKVVLDDIKISLYSYYFPTGKNPPEKLPHGLAFTISLYFNSISPILPDGLKNEGLSRFSCQQK